MKKLIIFTTAILLSGFTAFAQKDTQAKTILAQLSKKYHSYNTIKTDFTFTGDNPQAGGKISQNGTLLASPKAGKFKVTLFNQGSKTSVEQEIISDGKSQWTYLVKDKEVQVTTAAKGSDEMNPAKLFTIYEHGYKYIYTGEQKVNSKVCQVIDLSPESVDKDIFKIRLLVDKAKKLIYSAQIFDKSGARYTYTLNTFTANTAAAASSFIFDTKAHPGVEVVDLR